MGLVALKTLKPMKIDKKNIKDLENEKIPTSEKGQICIIH